MMRDERLYRVLLRAYPAQFRREYERELVLVFRDQQRDGATRNLSYWSTLVFDVFRSATKEWSEVITTNTLTEGISMKGFAIAAVLVAAFELVNAGIEVQAGGFANRDALLQAGIVVTMLSMAALLFAGVMLMRGGRAASSFAGAAAACCIASLAFVGLARPIFSVASMFAGIAFPLALLAWLFVTRGRDASSVQSRTVG